MDKEGQVIMKKRQYNVLRRIKLRGENESERTREKG